jgi:hypothetical protein
MQPPYPQVGEALQLLLNKVDDIYIDDDNDSDSVNNNDDNDKNDDNNDNNNKADGNDDIIMIYLFIDIKKSQLRRGRYWLPRIIT